MNKLDLIKLLKKFKKEIPYFINDMESKSTPGKYSYSLSSDIISKNKFWGLAQSTFALRVLYMLDALTEKKSVEIISYIKSFEKDNGKIYDTEIRRRNIFRRLRQSFKSLSFDDFLNLPNIRAETRQAYASMINLGYSPKIFYKEFKVLNESNLEKYINSLDWSSPWGAASHFSHQFFFIHYSPNLTSIQKKSFYVKFKTLIKKYERNDGFYQKESRIPVYEKIGGIMKILMAFDLINSTKLIIRKEFVDLCLDEIDPNDACENFNTIYVLHHCLKGMNYRKNEILNFFLLTADKWKDYYFETHAGFSFNKVKKPLYYLGAKMSKGELEPDMHGTAMFIWGYVIIAKSLSILDNVKLNQPIL
jgi:hypothetical protein